MTASKLLDWHHTWKLEGKSLCCRKCGSVQMEEDGDGELHHSSTCPAYDLCKSPWNELKALIDENTKR